MQAGQQSRIALSSSFPAMEAHPLGANVQISGKSGGLGADTWRETPQTGPAHLSLDCLGWRRLRRRNASVRWHSRTPPVTGNAAGLSCVAWRVASKLEGVRRCYRTAAPP